MFNLDQAIGDWRRQMAAGGINSAEVLDELESHLRDDVERQARAGTDAQRAFDSAVRRLGSAKALRREFAKSGGAEEPRRRRFVQGLCIAFAAGVLVINTWTLIEFDLSVLERLAGSSALALAVSYLAGVPFLHRLLSGVAHARLMGAIKIAGWFVVLLPIGALLTAVHVIHLEIGIIATMILWLLYAAVVITSFACGFGDDDGRECGSRGPLPPFLPGPQSMPPGRPCPPGAGIRLPRSKAFAPIARQTLEVAREEASRLGHDFIGTEHLLLAMLKLAEGGVATVLQNSNVDRESVRIEIERLVAPQPGHTPTATPPLTPRARRALRLAASEAKTLKSPLINAEHILLGLLREGGGVAAQALRNLGLRSERIRAAISKPSEHT
jgi:hypothetical protein